MVLMCEVRIAEGKPRVEGYAAGELAASADLAGPAAGVPGGLGRKVAGAVAGGVGGATGGGRGYAGGRGELGGLFAQAVSYGQARKFVRAGAGVAIGKRQLEQITAEAAEDGGGFEGAPAAGRAGPLVLA